MKKRRVCLALALTTVVVVSVPLYGNYRNAARQAELDQALVTAVKAGDFSTVQIQLSLGADPNAEVEEVRHLGFRRFLKSILTRGQPHSEVTQERRTVLKVLMESVSKRGYDFQGEYDTIGAELIDHGADFHFTVGQWQPLCVAAAAMDMPKTLRSLLAHGEASHVRGQKGVLPLMEAHGECIQILLDAGASPNPAQAGLYSPLINAVQVDDMEGVRALLAAGAYPNGRDANGTTALMHTGTPEIAEILIRHGADLNAHDSSGYTVLSYAAGNTKLFTSAQHRELLALLKRHGIRPVYHSDK